MSANDQKKPKYNLYHIISEKIEKEQMPLKLYCDMLVTIMKRVEIFQHGEIKEANEQGNTN